MVAYLRNGALNILEIMSDEEKRVDEILKKMELRFGQLHLRHFHQEYDTDVVRLSYPGAADTLER